MSSSRDGSLMAAIFLVSLSPAFFSAIVYIKLFEPDERTFLNLITTIVIYSIILFLISYIMPEIVRLFLGLNIFVLALFLITLLFGSEDGIKEVLLDSYGLNEGKKTEKIVEENFEKESDDRYGGASVYLDENDNIRVKYSD